MTSPAPPAWFAATLETLIAGVDLRADQVVTMMEAFLQGGCGEAETAALLVALRIKGATAGELATAAGVLRRYCSPVGIEGELFDTCGTGGDGSDTFHISTATALVVAGAGVPVVKHGNRAVSSRSGSADVLTELGVTVTGDPEVARRCLERAGMAFCLAPLYHPALRHVGEVRRRLGVRTVFNCLGPLANPAGVPYQLLGVGRAEWLDPMAGALAQLGARRGLLVHSHDGLDEVSLSAPTLVRQVQPGVVTAAEWTAEDFGLPACSLADLRVDGVQASAATIRAVLAGRDGPPLNVVLANAAAALLVVGSADSLRQGVERARAAVTSGRAAAVLAALVEQTRNGV
ncbi:MAG: anthranilate phosphoribosyltransferase [Gemmataceae bacterium]